MEPMSELALLFFRFEVLLLCRWVLGFRSLVLYRLASTQLWRD